MKKQPHHYIHLPDNKEHVQQFSIDDRGDLSLEP